MVPLQAVDLAARARPAGTEAGQDQQLYQSEMSHAVRRELDRLAPKERAAFVLRHFQDHSIAEISQITGLRPNAVKQAIFRAVRKLRNALQVRSVF